MNIEPETEKLDDLEQQKAAIETAIMENNQKQGKAAMIEDTIRSLFAMFRQFVVFFFSAGI